MSLTSDKEIVAKIQRLMVLEMNLPPDVGMSGEYRELVKALMPQLTTKLEVHLF